MTEHRLEAAVAAGRGAAAPAHLTLLDLTPSAEVQSLLSAERAKSWIEARYGPPSPPRGGIDGIWNLAAVLTESGEAGGTALDWRDAVSAEIGRFAAWRRP